MTDQSTGNLPLTDVDGTYFLALDSPVFVPLRYRPGNLRTWSGRKNTPKFFQNSLMCTTAICKPPEPLIARLFTYNLGTGFVSRRTNGSRITAPA